MKLAVRIALFVTPASPHELKSAFDFAGKLRSISYIVLKLPFALVRRFSI